MKRLFTYRTVLRGKIGESFFHAKDTTSALSDPGVNFPGLEQPANRNGQLLCDIHVRSASTAAHSLPPLYFLNTHSLSTQLPIFFKKKTRTHSLKFTRLERESESDAELCISSVPRARFLYETGRSILGNHDILTHPPFPLLHMLLLLPKRGI